MAQVRKSVLQGRILLAMQEVVLHAIMEKYLLRGRQFVLHVHPVLMPILLMFHVFHAGLGIIAAVG